HAHGQLPVEQLAGKVVLDTDNYYPQRDGNVAELDEGRLTSAELEQRHFGPVKVVKVFNNIFFRHLQSLPRPAGAADRTALTIAGDDVEAKRMATALLDAIGYDAVDVGPLAESWRVQPGQPAYGPPYGRVEGPVGPPGGDEKVGAGVAGAGR